MQIVKGKYNKAKIFTDIVDEKAIEQIRTMCDTSVLAQSKIRIMPDVHAGVGCTIGTTMTIADKVVPNMVGVDIGCGMELVRIVEKELNLSALDELIYARIPSGCRYRETHHKYTEQIDLRRLRCVRHVNIDLAYISLGTLGGGNHFIEVDKDEEGNLYIVVHSGSRRLGKEVAEYYQNEGYRSLCGNSKIQLNKIIMRLKAEGREREIESTIRAAKQNTSEIPQAMAYVKGVLFDDYIHDMRLVQQFAVLNRQAMIDEIISGMGLTVAEQFTTIHNYIDTEHMILRKGAVSAKKGEKLIIPINMRDGSLICIGKGNADWNESAPHGAGRILSRGKAREMLTMEEFEREMKGIYSTSINTGTLDESPMAYKKIDDIVNNISPTVDIVKRLLPIYNYKESNFKAIAELKFRQELREAYEQQERGEEEYEKAEYDRTVAELQNECKKMPDYNEEDGTFLIKMDITYPNGMPFRIKIVEDEGRLYMSDCGKTIDYLAQFSNREALINYFKATLKSENICMIENAICTTIDDIYDLTQEGALLFNVVSDLITKKNPDRYCFSEELVSLANIIMENNDAAMIVNVLSVIDDKPMRITMLQKTLHIGHARATRIVDKLAELGILESGEILTIRLGEISKAFISYLRWMLITRKE